MSLDELRDLEDPETAAREAGLRYVSDDEPGFYRHRRGKGWSYHRPDGTLITDERLKERLNSLAIPPAWTDVWICSDPDGHLLATGRDADGRKQYIYHPAWRTVRDVGKYARMIPFGRALPRLRRRVARDLRREGLPREKVLAIVVRLLERTLIRVGNRRYAEENDSYGLTSLRKKHVDLAGETLQFSFRGKGGQPVSVELEDPRLAEVVRQLRDVPGYDLFKYVDDGERRTIGSGDVNAYLREVTGEDFTAKDFRTWAGTLHAVAELRGVEPPEDERAATAQVKQAIERVAERLGNTPAVCRAGYVYPAVIERYQQGDLDATMRAAERDGFEPVSGLSKKENAVLALLYATLEEARSE